MSIHKDFDTERDMMEFDATGSRRVNLYIVRQANRITRGITVGAHNELATKKHICVSI